MVRGIPLVCKQTDIFSLGCLAYELATGIKLFERDYNLFEYMSTRRRPQVPELEMDGLSQILLSQLIHAMLKVDWWKRPSAQDILNGLDAISLKSSDLVPSSSGPDCPGHSSGVPHKLQLKCPRDGNIDLTKLVWKPHWYVL